MEHPENIEGKDGTGLKVGDVHYDTVIMRQLNAAEVSQAAQAGERLVFAPARDGGDPIPLLVQSPAKVTEERICRMVARLEAGGGQSHPGPLNTAFLKELSSRDYDAMIAAAELIDAAAANVITGVDKRGRDPGADGDD